MKKQLFIIICFVLFAVYSCANEPTRIAIENNGNVTVDSVTVSSSDGVFSVTFTSIAAGATSPYQEVSSSGVATVTCADTNQCTSGTVDIAAEKDNAVSVTNSGAPGNTSSGGGGGGWL